MASSSGLHLALDIPGLDVSVVDARPQELLLLSVDKLSVEYHWATSAGVPYTLIALHVQVRRVHTVLTPEIGG